MTVVSNELRGLLAPAVKRSKEQPLIAEDEQISIVNGLRDRFSHSITLVLRDSGVPRPHDDAVNCYEFALGLFEHPRYWDILDRARYRIPPQGLLIEDLIAAGLERLDSPRDNALVVYRSDCIGHVGLARGGGVRSKWSPGGCVWDHAPLEIPETYGSVVGYYMPPRIDQTLGIFANEMNGICRRPVEWHNAH
jgi:hypothetical protein